MKRFMLLYDKREFTGQATMSFELTADNKHDAIAEACQHLMEREAADSFSSGALQDRLYAVSACRVVEICGDDEGIDEDHPTLMSAFEDFEKHEREREAADEAFAKAQRRQEYEILKKEFES